jgi:xylulokinase
MSLMNYSGKRWDKKLVSACSKGLPGGSAALMEKLGSLDTPIADVGFVAAYFAQRFGFRRDAIVLAGSGDNPQTKVLLEGDLLSLGTSFVNMVATKGEVDPKGAFNAMYDGLGRSFMFGCRTNGALTWDKVRLQWGFDRGEYKKADAALADVKVGECLVIFQPDTESFPKSPAGSLRREYSGETSFAKDYAGVIDSSLALIYLTSKEYSSDPTIPLAVTGGPSGSPLILERIAAIWGRPVLPVGKTGAGAGAACAGIYALLQKSNETSKFPAIVKNCVGSGTPVQPNAEASEALRKPGAYFDQLTEAFKNYGA